MTVHDAFDDMPTAETLLVTVQGDDAFYEEGRRIIDRLEDDESIEEPDTFSFRSVEALFETFTPQTMGLLDAIAEHEPESIRETARLVDRDVKNVHEELTKLARLGLVRFEQQGQAKRPKFRYDEVLISLPFGPDDASDVVSVPT